MERLLCSKCGTVAACGCGAPYVSKVEYAAAHMNPKKSARQNAKELNVSVDTAAKALKRVSEKQTPEFKSKQPKQKKPKSKTGRPRGRPPGFSLDRANALRGKAREQYLEAWGKHDYEKRLLPAEKWEIDLMAALNHIVAMEDQDNWQQFTITPCTHKLLSRAAAMLNRMLEGYVKGTMEADNVVRH